MLCHLFDSHVKFVRSVFKMFKQRLKGHSRDIPQNPIMASRDDLDELLQTDPENTDAAIYVHIPFCDNICSFCSMNRTKLEDELDNYTKFLLKEFDRYGKTAYMSAKKIGSVYFGGGTPTILKQSHLEPIITSIKRNFNLSDDCEFSLESTLHNLSLSKLNLLQSLGVNRFSIGIQTFSNRGRKLLNRVHNKDEAINHLGKIRDNFNGLMCIDIIYNYPEESIEEVLEDARLVRELGIDSTSFYSLQFFENSVLAKNMSEDYYNLDTDKALHHTFIQYLLNSNEYEILEYTKLNKKDRDEYKYIRLSHAGADILPIGKGSGGRLGDYAIYNISEKSQMISQMNQKQRAYSRLCALFQYDKISFQNIKKFVSDECFDVLLKFFKECENSGYLNIKNDNLDYTLDGIFWGNSIAARVSEIAKEF